MSHVLAIILLVIAAGVTLCCALGFVRTRDSLVRFHYLTPTSTVAMLAVALAVVLDGGSASMGVKAIIAFLITAVTSPVTQHAIARAIWVRRSAAWTLPEEEAR